MIHLKYILNRKKYFLIWSFSSTDLWLVDAWVWLAENQIQPFLWDDLTWGKFDAYGESAKCFWHERWCQMRNFGNISCHDECFIFLFILYTSSVLQMTFYVTEIFYFLILMSPSLSYRYHSKILYDLATSVKFVMSKSLFFYLKTLNFIILTFTVRSRSCWTFFISRIKFTQFFSFYLASSKLFEC